MLSQRKDHLGHLARLLHADGIEPLTLVGGQTRAASRAVIDQLAHQAATGAVVALATGSYLGEGFDLPDLDTLFLPFPLRSKGLLIQYVGRLLRPDPNKTDIHVYDYLDTNVAVLVAMHRKRLPTYRTLGFPIPPPHSPTTVDPTRSSSERHADPSARLTT